MLSLNRLATFYRDHRRASVVMLVALVGVVGFGAFRLSRGDETQYFTAAVEQGDILAVVSATGTINAVTTVQVGSQVSGQIAELHVDFNSKVHKGELIAQIDPAIFRTRVLQAEADLASAEAGVKTSEADLATAQANLEKTRAELRQADLNLKRTLELFQQGIASTQERDGVQVAYDAAAANVRAGEAQVAQARARLDQQKAQVKQRQAALEQARLDLQHTTIYAPIDGTVIARNVDIGQTVAASLQAPVLFTIAQDLTKMLVYAKTDESDVGKIRVGAEATFKVDSYPQDTFRGRVTQVRMNAYTVQNVVTYDTIIEVANPGLKLLPGMTAYVTIPVGSATNVVKIPNGALRFTPDLPEAERRALLQKHGLLGPAAAPGSTPGTVQAQEQGAGTSSGSSEADRARFRERMQNMSPEERERARAEWMARRGGGGQEGGGSPGPPRSGSVTEANYQIVWKLKADNSLEPLRVKTGLTDFTFTAQLDGALKPGDKLVIGQTSRRGQQAGLPLGGGMRR